MPKTNRMNYWKNFNQFYSNGKIFFYYFDKLNNSIEKLKV